MTTAAAHRQVCSTDMPTPKLRISNSLSKPSSPDVLYQTDELLSLPGGTIHHIPPVCRKPLADAFAEALRRLHEKRDVQYACWSPYSLVWCCSHSCEVGGSTTGRPVE